MAQFLDLLIVEGGTGIEDGALIVIDIIAETVIESEVEGEVLIVEGGEDITVDVWIWIANHHLIVLVYHSIIILIDEMHVASLEVFLIA